MSILKVSCNDCNTIINNDNIYRDYDDIYRCKKCYIKNKLFNERMDYQELKRWLKETHIKQLKKHLVKIKQLELELESI